MTSKVFVIWLRGFVEAAHDYTPTPKQWDTLKEKLTEVSDEERIGTPNGTVGTVFTTTPGVSSITIANPPFGFGSTSTAYGYPSGSAWSYTNSTDEKIL
jgi:hypothetical protein